MLLVSIHDVSPAQASAVDRLWSLCAERGITPTLLVVPNWHGEWPLQSHPRLVQWVRARAADGAEIALHGERHDEVGLPRRPADRWRAWGRTDGEGEFLTLDATAARERLLRGLELLREVGLEPTGFVPPAWLAREVAHEAAAALCATSRASHAGGTNPVGSRPTLRNNSRPRSRRSRADTASRV